jgi:hypothetical protein
MSRLIKCKACGGAVSEKAPTCPKCGEPLKRKVFGRGPAIVSIFIALAIGIVLFSYYETGTQPIPKPATAVDCGTLAEREEFVAGMIERGYWASVQYTPGVARLEVMPFFMTSVSFDDKQQYVNVVAAINKCKGGGLSVVLIDAMTDKTIGTYAEIGLVLD